MLGDAYDPVQSDLASVSSHTSFGSHSEARHQRNWVVVYEPEDCVRLANHKIQRLVRKSLDNPNNYVFFALSLYMRLLGWDFATGLARSVDTAKTDGRTVDELTRLLGRPERVSLNDIQERRGSRWDAVRDLWYRLPSPRLFPQPRGRRR